MHILFLSHYYPPEVNAPASRTAEHCRAWVREGHTVSVVTCVPNHPHGRLYPGFRNKLYQKQNCDGVNVYRILTLLTPNSGVMLRTASFLLYFVMATLIAPFLPRVDIVVSTSPQFFCGLAGLPVSRIKRVPWVLEIRDLWPEFIVAVDAMRPGRIIRLLGRLAAYAYRKADGVVALTESFSRHIKTFRGDQAGLTVITNGVDLALFNPERGDDGFAGKHGLEDKFVVAYIGTHGMAHGLETALEAAAMLRNRPHIAFLLVGDGAQRKHIESLRNKMGLDNVVMLGQQPKKSMPAIWASIDASLVLLRDRPAFATVLPSKMFEAMAMQKPVILGVRGESAELLAASSAGVAIEPESASELAAAVIALDADRQRSQSLGLAGRRFVIAHLDRNQLAQRYLTYLQSVIERR